MVKLSVIIVSYNVRDYLEQCLDSVFRAVKDIDAEVFVVDNDSKDSTVEMLTTRYPKARLIANHDNPGFSKANNQAIRESAGKYVLLLNPDTLVGEDLLADVLSYMDMHPDVGATAVKMLKQDGSFAMESRRGVPTPWTSFCKMSGLGSLFPRNKLFGRYYMQYLDKESVSEIEIISGACMFLRKSALDRVGLLDETFFMYGEDIDLSYRMLRAGYKNVYIPSPILHYKGESTQKNSYRYVNAFYSAMLIFFRKHYGDSSVLLSLPVKGAIYAKGFMNYIWQQLKHHTDSHDTLYYIKKSRFLLLGTDENLKKMESKCQSLGISYDARVVGNDILKHGHCSIIDSGSYDYIVYDMSVFSYTTMLHAFEKTAVSKPSPMMATYHPMSEKIITGSMII